MAGFIFGAGTPYKSHAAVQKQRAIADALAAQAMDNANATTLPQGVANFATGIAAALMNNRASKAEAAGRADYNSRFKDVTRSLVSGGPKMASAASTDIASGIKETAAALGIDPVHLATAISYETAGTFDPAKAGPTTKWGQHRGLIQFGEPQAQKYGVDWNNPVSSQLGAGKAIARYLQDAGVKPGMKLMDIYSAINAGRVGRYGASDAAAGGAPGTVADKVNGQMAGHYQKALALLDDNQGVQIVPAGETPQIVPASAPPPAAAPQQPNAYQRMMLNSMDKQGGNVGPIARAQQAAIGAPQSQQQPAPVSGFFTGLLPQDATQEQAAAVQQAEQNLSAMPIEQIAELASSPYAEDWQKNLMQQYLEHRMQQQFQDPMEREVKRLQLKKAQQDLLAPAKSRPASAEEKRSFGLPENAPVYIKPDGTPEILDTSKIGGGAGYRPATAEEKQQFGVAPETPLVMSPDNKPTILSDGKTTVNVGGGSDKQIFDETKARADAARAANTGLAALQQAQNALPGAITGAGANERLALQKVASLFGIGDTSSIADTETFRSAIAPQVAAMMRATVGSTQISNADREFAEKAAGGSITLDAQSIQRLLNIMWVANSEIVRGFNEDLNKVYPEGQGFDRERALFSVPQAARAYSQPIGPQAPAGQPPQQGGVDPVNPKPGDIVLGYRFKGGNRRDPKNWEKVQ